MKLIMTYLVTFIFLVSVHMFGYFQIIDFVESILIKVRIL